MVEVILMVKRENIDKTWQPAPYRVTDEASAERIVKFLRKAWAIPFAWKLATLTSNSPCRSR